MLSMAKRICLIKFVITALPLFYFSFFKAPKAVCNQIRKIQAKFLWGWGSEDRKIVWVKWIKVCCLVEVGGSEIKDIECFNYALLAKWKWRYRLMDEGLWSKVLNARYDNWRNLVVTLTHRRQSTWWQDLCRIFDKVELGNWFNRRCQWSLGDGRSIKFWEDRWVDGEVLKEKFPRLFTITQCSDCEVGDLAHREHITSEGCPTWKVGWRRERFVWKRMKKK